jgi:hypothetical protein
MLGARGHYTITMKGCVIDVTHPFRLSILWLRYSDLVCINVLIYPHTLLFTTHPELKSGGFGIYMHEGHPEERSANCALE